MTHDQLHEGKGLIGSRIPWLNTLRPRQSSRHYTDDIFKYTWVNDKKLSSNEIWLKFVLKSPIDNVPAVVQIMAWHRRGDKPLSELMMAQITDAYVFHSASMSWLVQPIYFSVNTNCIIVVHLRAINRHTHTHTHLHTHTHTHTHTHKQTHTYAVELTIMASCHLYSFTDPFNSLILG